MKSKTQATSNQCCGSGILCFFDPWIWDPDPGWEKNPDPG
jgi:hypothetical protein